MEKYSFQYCPKLLVVSADYTKVLLCKRKGEADYDGTFSFAGGKLEITDMSITEGMKREKDEELGSDFKVKLYETFNSNLLFKKKDGSSMVIPHYLAVYQEGEITLNSDEYSEYKWVEIDELDSFEPKIQNIPEMVRQILRLKDVLGEADAVSI